MFWSILKARIHSFARADGVALKVAKHFCVVPSNKPGKTRAVHAALLGIGVAPLAPGALANRFIIFVYNGSSAGCFVPTLLRTAVAKAGVGMLVGMTLGRTKRSPSVSKKKNVWFRSEERRVGKECRSRW